MPAAVEKMMYNKENGVPWHGEGTEVDGLATADEAITLGGLDFEVVKQPAFGHRKDDEGNDYFPEIPGKFEVVRTDTGASLGVVGEKMTLCQNKNAFTFMDTIVGQGKASYETCGSLFGGKRVWILAKIPGDMRIVGDDVVSKYLMLANGHDGEFQLQVCGTNVRVVCNNTVQAAVQGAQSVYKIRHTKSMMDNMAMVGEMFLKQEIYFQKFQEIAQAMTKVQTTDEEAKGFFFKVFEQPEMIVKARKGEEESELPEEEEEVENKFRALKHLEGLREDGSGTDLPGVRGTLWGDFNAVTEYLDHYKPRRKTSTHMDAAMFNPLNLRIKQRALSVAKDLILSN
jgi:phage/plasmid-like protein (TIGR03299 family)